jgi:hypothetical protein
MLTAKLFIIMFDTAISSKPTTDCITKNILKCDNIPVFASHQGQVLPAEFAKLFAHAAHSMDMLPSTRVLLLLHGNLQPSAKNRHSRKMQML